jgi:hypothetical protein
MDAAPRGRAASSIPRRRDHRIKGTERLLVLHWNTYSRGNVRQLMSQRSNTWRHFARLNPCNSCLRWELYSSVSTAPSVDFRDRPCTPRPGRC